MNVDVSDARRRTMRNLALDSALYHYPALSFPARKSETCGMSTILGVDD